VVAWLRSSTLPSQNYLILLAVIVGLLTGFGSVGFILLLRHLTDFAQNTVAGALGWFGPASVVLLPTLGGLLAGPLIVRFAKEAKGHGVPEVMTALATRAGRIRKRVVFVKVIGSALTIGFGGAAGREGPMVQIGSGIGSAVGQQAGLPGRQVRTMVACGAAGGVAATFNAPIAGAIFAMEVLMGRVQTDFLLVLLTSLSSVMVARHYLGNYPAFMAPAYHLVSPGELLLYFLMGLVIGLAAVFYVRALYWSEDVAARWVVPDSLKPAIGGLIVGLVLYFYPQVYGTGLSAMESTLWVRFPWDLLLGLFAAELIANCATLGSGGSGGVFAPSLYMGAMLGGAFGTLAHLLFPEWTASSGAYAMVGMAAFFAAAAKAPTTAILILFEMTNDYRIVVPLMAATVGSVYVSHWLLPHSIYILKLHKRGVVFPIREESEEPGHPASPVAAAPGAPAPIPPGSTGSA
jgi:CIC family chloride channel protein